MRSELVNELVEEEKQTLSAIYGDEITIIQEPYVEYVIAVSISVDDATTCFLHLRPTIDYPTTPPEIEIHGPSSKIRNICTELKQSMIDGFVCGEASIFTMIEAGREYIETSFGHDTIVSDTEHNEDDQLAYIPVDFNQAADATIDSVEKDSMIDIQIVIAH